MIPCNHIYELGRFLAAEDDAEARAEQRNLYAHDLYAEALSDDKAFRAMDDDYEIIDRDGVRRMLSNLNSAIAGKEYAMDAIFTVLNQMDAKLRFAAKHIAGEE